MIKSVHSAAYKALIESLIAERMKQGLTMRELADRLGVVHTFVSKIEKRERNLSVQEFVQYATALNLDYKALLDELAMNLRQECS